MSMMHDDMKRKRKQTIGKLFTVTPGRYSIRDLDKQNDGLRIKNLHKFFNKYDLPWVQLCWSYYQEGVPQVANMCGSFWWRDIMKLVHKYSEI